MSTRTRPSPPGTATACPTASSRRAQGEEGAGRRVVVAAALCVTRYPCSTQSYSVMHAERGLPVRWFAFAGAVVGAARG